MLGTNPRPLAYSRPSGSFLVTSATPGTLAWYTLNPSRSATLVTRSGLASTNLAPRGFCWSSKPRTISGGEAVAGAVEDLLTAPFAALTLTVVFADLLFRFVISGSPEKPKGPGEGGPCGGWVAGNRRQRPDTFRAAVSRFR